MRKSLNVSWYGFVLVMVIGCSKDVVIPDKTKLVSGNSTVVPPSIPAGKTHSGARYNTYPFDWEGANKDFMPTPSGILIETPWNNGPFIDKGMLNDRKASEGWELYLNTFNTSAIQQPTYFALYNKYRGIMRIYYYTYNITNIPSSQILHKIATKGSYATNSKVLNFASRFIVDVASGTNQTSLLTTDPQTQVAPNTWYAFEYELAYDQNLAPQNFGTFSFDWFPFSTSFSNITVNGTQQGSITGNMSMDGAGLNIAGGSTFNLAGQQAIFNVVGKDAADKFLPMLGQAVVNGLKDAITDGIGGIVAGFASGIFGAGNEDNVDLKVNTTISLTGTIGTNYVLTPLEFAASGYDQSATGMEPHYSGALGVFYLSNRPTVNETIHITSQTDGNGFPIAPRYSYEYQSDPGSATLIFNSDVTSQATIQNVQWDVVLQDQYHPVAGAHENIPGLGLTYTGSYMFTDDYQGAILCTRISFDVVPNNGSPRVKIVKSFTSNRNSTEVYHDGGGGDQN
jgi:hypothetical protein